MSCERNAYFLVDLLRRHTVLGYVVKKSFDFDGVSFEAFVHISSLDKVPEIRKPVQVLRTE